MRAPRDRTASQRARFEPALAASTPIVRETIAQLVDADPRARARALDGLSDLLIRPSARDDIVVEAIPHVVALASSRGYPESSALLVRVAALASEPRSLAIEGALRACVPTLLHLARTASDPEAARVAACIVSRFPEGQREVEPILIALLSGARDRVERARVLYALTRVQASRGAVFQARIADALHRGELDEEAIAVALALADHDPPEPLRARLARTLRDARGGSFADPSAWGRTLAPPVIDRALAKLER